MWKTLTAFVLMSLLAVQSAAQVVKPPYVLGKNDVRIKSRNFLARKKPEFGTTYKIYQNGALIYFDKKTNEFEIVTGAENNGRAIREAKQELRKAEKVLLTVTGITPTDKCKLKILMRIVVPGTTDGGVSYDHLPSCGDF